MDIQENSRKMWTEKINQQTLTWKTSARDQPDLRRIWFHHGYPGPISNTNDDSTEAVVMDAHETIQHIKGACQKF